MTPPNHLMSKSERAVFNVLIKRTAPLFILGFCVLVLLPVGVNHVFIMAALVPFLVGAVMAGRAFWRNSYADGFDRRLNPDD